MKFEKTTKQKAAVRHAGRERWYDDACGTAFGLELIGERWTLLIMRELMFGPRRFSELRRDLPGVSASVLTQRLADMEQRGIIERRTLPSPANVQVIELTEWGLEAEPLIQILGKWATRHPGHDSTLPLSAASIMMSFRTMFDPARATGASLRIGFRPDDREFLAIVGNGALSVGRANLAAEKTDAVATGPATALAALVYGGARLADLEREAALAVDGNRRALTRFAKLFALPEKVDAG